MSTTTALTTATRLMEWMGDPEELKVFAVNVMTHLRCCLPRCATFRRGGKEAMWKSYYQLRTSSHFRLLWKEFVMKAVAVDVHPILYQYVTGVAFQTLLEEKFASSRSIPLTVPNPWTYEEGNALRYVAGYVCQ